jgi:hypothetical protein
LARGGPFWGRPTTASKHAGLGSEPGVPFPKGTSLHPIAAASCRLKSAQGDEDAFRLRQGRREMPVRRGKTVSRKVARRGNKTPFRSPPEPPTGPKVVFPLHRQNAGRAFGCPTGPVVLPAPFGYER